MLEIGAGFVLGILASIIAWYVLQHHVVPALEFFPKIYKARTDENPSGYKYRIKFQNAGRREILDFELFAKLRIRGLSPNHPGVWRAIYIPVDDPRIPRIASHRGTAKRLAVQLLVSDVSAHVVSALPEELQEVHKKGQLSLEQLMGLGCEVTLEMIGFGYDAFSGARKVVQSMIYGLTDIIDES